MPETALAFALLFVVGLILAFVVRPIFGLYTYIGVFYLHPPSRWWGEALPDVRWSLVAATATLLAIAINRASLQQKPQWLQMPIFGLFLSYTVWMWLQSLWVVSEYHLEGTVLFAKYVMLIYIMYALIETMDDIRDFCLANVLGCAFFGVLIFAAPDAGRLEGVGGPGVNDANTLGMHLATGLFFASFLLVATKGWRRWIIVMSIPFIVNGIVQTETRGAIVGIAVAGIVSIYLKPTRIRKAYYSLAAIGAIGAIVFANQAFLNRMSTLSAAVDDNATWDSSAESRIEIAKSQIEMFVDHPFGVGHQGTAWLSPKYIDERWLTRSGGRRSSHNTLLSVLVDQGLPGFVIYLLLVFSAIRMLVRLKREDKKGLSLEAGLYRASLGCALVVVFVSGMFAQYLKAEVQIWCICLLVILWRLTFPGNFEPLDAKTENSKLVRL